MSEAVLTVANLAIATMCFTACAAKVLATRRAPDATLWITASVHLHAGVVYVFSAPMVYRAVGSYFGSPSLPSLVVDICILWCVALAHVLTVLWHPRKRTPDMLRRMIIPWGAMYLSAIGAMVLLFWAADLTGPARPLSFATSYAHIPEAFAFQLVYHAALIVATIAVVRQCGGPDGVIALPEHPELARGLRFFTAAVALHIVNVTCTLTAVIAAASGRHGLGWLASFGMLASSSSALVATYGMVKPALAAWWADRQDFHTLGPLWETVVVVDPEFELAPRSMWWSRGGRWDLCRRLIEILDCIRNLGPWMSTAPALAVQALADAEPEAGFDVEAAQAAATLKHAAANFVAARERAAAEAGEESADPEPPIGADLSALPGGDSSAVATRPRLVGVAQYLNHPIVDAALKVVVVSGSDQTSEASRS